MQQFEEKICCLLLSEFDIDAGASLRCAFPPAKAEKYFDLNQLHDSLANQMLPDGAEKVEISSTVFLLNRIRSKPLHRFPVHAFQPRPGGTDWTPYRGAAAILPEMLVIDGTESTLSLHFHDRVLMGPSDVSHVRFEFPEATPHSVAMFIAQLKSQLGCETSTLSDGSESEDSKDYVFLQAIGFRFEVGLIIESADLQSILKLHHKLVEFVDSPTSSMKCGESRSPMWREDVAAEDMILPGEGKHARLSPRSTPLYGLAAVFSKKDSSARRGGITKALAAVGPSLGWLQSIFPVLLRCAEKCCTVNSADENSGSAQLELLKDVFESVHSEDAKVMLDYPSYSRADALKALVKMYSTSSLPYSIKVPRTINTMKETFEVFVPAFPTVDDILLQDYHLESLLMLFGPQFMSLLFGVLQGKKIVVLSRERTAFDVCQVVIALGIIGSFFHPDFFHRKVFPYVSISDTDFSDVPGYIIGTMNPIFENANAWGWDLLCDLDAHTVRSRSADRSVVSNTTSTVSQTLASAVGIAESGVERLDLLPHEGVLYTQLVNCMQHMKVLRTPIEERCLRLKLVIEEYCHTLVVAGFCECTEHVIPQAVHNVFFTSSSINALAQCQTAGLTSHVEDYILCPNENPSVLLCCAALRRCRTGDPFNVLRILEQLKKLIKTEDDIIMFLRRMPLSCCGLSPVAIQLTHPSLEVRRASCGLLQKIESCELGKAAISAVSNFLLVLYEDCKRFFSEDSS